MSNRVTMYLYWLPVTSVPSEQRSSIAIESMKTDSKVCLYKLPLKTSGQSEGWKAQLLLNAGEIVIWKRSYPRSGAHFTNPSEKRSFSKTLFLNRSNVKTSAFRFRVDSKHFENGVFWKRCSHVVFLPVFFQTEVKSDWWLLRFQIHPG